MSCSKTHPFARSSTGPDVLFEAAIGLHQAEVVCLPPAGPLHRVEFHLAG